MNSKEFMFLVLAVVAGLIVYNLVNPLLSKAGL
jgi:hypothetical protein